MSIVTDLRQALAAALDAGTTGCQVSAYVLANPTSPSVSVMPPAVAYHHAFGAPGPSVYAFKLRALAAITTDIGAQQTLDDLIGTHAGSVKAAVEADTTLGGACSSVIVRENEEPQVYVTAGGGQLLGVDWTVEVFA